MKYENTMVDLETLSTKANAVIVSIGVTVFDHEGIRATFYAPVDIESYEEYGNSFDISPSTVAWWMKQNKEAHEAFFKAQGTATIHEALVQLAEWWESHCKMNRLKVWGNGSDFDNVILSNAYNTLGLKTPWRFYNNRCYRTVKNMCPLVKMERSGTHHNALDDAISQTEHLLELNEYDMEVFS